MLDNIRIVLVRTFHPGNIGSAARAMKTMGLTQLYLVAPRNYPDPEAQRLAAGAEDIVNNAIIVGSIYDAVKECNVVAASTARPRTHDLPEMDPSQCAMTLIENARSGKVALLFGPERMGLNNEDLLYARYRVTIPANPAYSSLNMAAAVQTLSYEIYRHSLLDRSYMMPDHQRIPDDLPTTHELEQFYTRLERTLKDIDFINRSHPGNLMLELRNLFDRAQPDNKDLNILNGILGAIRRIRNRD